MAAQLTDEERRTIAYGLRHPRGRYVAERAAQLSGVPKSTIYDWRREGVFCPDFTSSTPANWSYRDLVLLRVLAWLRQGGMPRPTAAKKVQKVKTHLSRGAEVRYIRATQSDVVLDGTYSEEFDDDRANLLPSTDFLELLATFDLHEPIRELRSARNRSVWAPDLVTPSVHSFISPWVLSGDPCVTSTRIPTSAIHALRFERALPVEAIVDLYPGLSIEAAKDVIELEMRLRGTDAEEVVHV